MFSMGKKNKAEEIVKVEEVIIKKAERNEERPMDNSIKKVDVKIGESATIVGTMSGSCIANIGAVTKAPFERDSTNKKRLKTYEKTYVLSLFLLQIALENSIINIGLNR